MSLIACHECKAEVSTEAKTCPKCGAKPRKPTGSTAGIIAGVVAGAFGLIVILGAMPDKKTDPESQISDKRYKAARAGAYSLKASMRDPESFTLEAAEASEDGSVACYKYHSRNGFGGMNTGWAVVEPIMGIITNDTTDQDGFKLVWDRECPLAKYDELKLVAFALQNGY